MLPRRAFDIQRVRPLFLDKNPGAGYSYKTICACIDIFALHGSGRYIFDIDKIDKHFLQSARKQYRSS
jgi:hypothetical protein